MNPNGWQAAKPKPKSARRIRRAAAKLQAVPTKKPK